MLWQQIVLVLCGLAMIAIGIGHFRAWISRLIIYRHIVDELDEETRKKYQKSVVPPYILLGLCFITYAIAYPYIKAVRSAYAFGGIWLAGLLVYFIWHMVCNKKYLGRYTSLNFKGRTR